MLVGDDGPDVADEESRGPEGKADTPGEGCWEDWLLSLFCFCQPVLPLSTVRAGLCSGAPNCPVPFCGSGGQCGPSVLPLTDRFLLAIVGPEDGGVKASPVPSDPEKPGTPGEGMLSSDLDRIPTEGEAVTCVPGVQGASVGEGEGPTCGILTSCFSGHLPRS